MEKMKENLLYMMLEKFLNEKKQFEEKNGNNKIRVSQQGFSNRKV